MQVVIDEISYLASSQVVLYAGDAVRAAATISDLIKESRRSRLSMLLATQRPVEILPEIRDSATNVFFRELSMSRDKMRSQVDFLLDSIQIEDALRDVVRTINNRGLLRKGKYWFWYNAAERDLDVIKPCPPTFSLQDPRLTPRALIRVYEKVSGKQVLLKSWNEVKSLKTRHA